MSLRVSVTTPNLPPGWSLSRLGYEARVKARLGWKGLKADEYVRDGYIFLSTPNIKGSEIDFANVNYITEQRYLESPEIMLERGDVLLAKDGSTLGIANVVRKLPAPATVNSSIAVIRPGTNLESRFLFYLIQSRYVQSIIEQVKGGMGVPHLFQADLRMFPVFFPPIATQRAIADFLDRKTRAIDELIRKKERLIELLQEKRQALITQAVTKGLDPNVPMKDSGVPWLGATPAHWEVRQLGHTLSWISYGFTNPMPTTEDGPFMLTANDIGDGEIKYRAARRTDLAEYQRLTRKSRPEAGEILLTKDGTLGRVAVADGQQVCINQSVAILHSTEKLASIDFTQHALRAECYQEAMRFDAGGTTIKHIYITRLVKMKIALPPKTEQKKICDFATRTIHQSRAILDAVAHQIEVLREYRQALISAAVTGHIDVTEEAAA